MISLILSVQSQLTYNEIHVDYKNNMFLDIYPVSSSLANFRPKAKGYEVDQQFYEVDSLTV